MSTKQLQQFPYERDSVSSVFCIPVMLTVVFSSDKEKQQEVCIKMIKKTAMLINSYDIPIHRYVMNAAN